MSGISIGGDWVGRVIDGKFTLLRWLGGTERSGVFLAERENYQARRAALKLILADGVDASACLARWAAAKNLSDPHLICVIDAGQCVIDGTDLLYVVTEYADEVLAEVLPGRPLTPEEAKEMLEPMLGALSYLHGKGLVHGHLKPSNILAVHDELKLSADCLDTAGRARETSSPLSIYDAPEAGADPISPAADIWSLGIMLVEALTQHPPVWDRSTGREVVLPESIPQPFVGIARECLRIDPARRCTLGDIKARLAPGESSLEQPAPKETETTPAAVGESVPAAALEPVEAIETEIGSGSLRLKVIVAAVVVLIAVVVALWLRPHQTRPSSPVATAPHQVSALKPQGAPVKGAVAHRVLPDVPESASATIEGHVRVRVRLQVDREGNVAKATFDYPGPSQYFARLAINAARQWKFKPAQADGQPVPSMWILHFQFAQTGLVVTPVEVSP